MSRCIDCGSASCEGEHTNLNEYIDTRGVWPVYIKGMRAIKLIGKPHNISLDDARAVALEIE